MVKDLDEVSDFPESGARDKLMLWNNGEFARNLRHPCSLKCSKECLSTCGLKIHGTSPLAT